MVPCIVCFDLFQLPKNSHKNTKLMNVLFYIFGGGFSAGYGGRMIPDYILQDEDIIFVGINYRVGPLGGCYVN